MVMDWDSLFKKQRELDSYIINNRGLHTKNVFEEKMLALLVELGELANETRCFKFWSLKDKSDKATILEEYVDNIHFLLSIGLEKGYTFSDIDVAETAVAETKGFNQVFSACLAFYQEQTRERYMAMFSEYLGLARMLGFSETDIIQAYQEKNEVNYERQQSGY